MPELAVKDSSVGPPDAPRAFSAAAGRPGTANRSGAFASVDSGLLWRTWIAIRPNPGAYSGRSTVPKRLAEKKLARNWRGASILDVRRLTVGFHMGNIG